jgi:S1-C subfamily serine protease
MQKNLLLYLSTIVVAAIVGALTTLLAVGVFAPKNTPTKTYVATNNVGEAQQTKSPARAVAPSVNYPDLSYAAEEAVKSVVFIEAKVNVGGYVDPLLELFGYYPQMEREAIASGSGVIISEDGYIVTNNHVIEDAKALRVRLYDGRAFDGKLVGRDPDTDVAVIKIEASDIDPLPFGSSDDLRLGEWVLAIGYPMELQSTITAGIVSAKARRLGAFENRSGIESFIQTDAAVNPGNSGGALVNMRGELVGINTMIKSSTGSYVGYSFAVPETIVRKVVTDLKETGEVQRAVLGISYRAIDQTFIDMYGERLAIDKVGGIFVSNVIKGGAAEAVGIKAGDVITSFDGISNLNEAALAEQISKHRPGDSVKAEVRRNDKAYTVTITLQDRHGNVPQRIFGK